MSDLSQSVASQIAPGTPIRCRDVGGRWLEMVAVSEVEGCYVNGKLTHDFAGVYVRPVNSDDEGMFWPLEDVEVA